MIDMLIWLFLIIFIVLVMYALWRLSNKWISATKSNRGSTTRVEIKVNTDLELLRFEDTSKENKKEKLEFRRKDLKKGDRLEFVYPLSNKTISITATKDEEEKTFEVEMW